MKRTWFTLVVELCDSRLERWVLKQFGYKIVYECEWGACDYLYDTLDFQMCRPCHPDMSVAPPWASLKIVSLDVPSK